MRILIYESKLIKTTRFEPEELEKIEHITKTLEREALEDRDDPPSESQVIRMLVRLGLESFYSRRKSQAETTEDMRFMRSSPRTRSNPFRQSVADYRVSGRTSGSFKKQAGPFSKTREATSTVRRENGLSQRRNQAGPEDL
jgi:hypothetical protein